MIEDIKKDAQSRMKKSLESLDVALKRVRTGRAHPSLLDGVTVAYYGSPTPLSQFPTFPWKRAAPWWCRRSTAPWFRTWKKRS